MTTVDQPYSEPIETNFPVPQTEDAARLLGLPWPYDDEADVALVWLMRESFDRHAASRGLVVVEFHDRGTISAQSLSPEVDANLGRPADGYTWRRFEGVAQRPPVSYWLQAEAVHDAGQAALEAAEETRA